jgi:hypothetical protein
MTLGKFKRPCRQSLQNLSCLAAAKKASSHSPHFCPRDHQGQIIRAGSFASTTLVVLQRTCSTFAVFQLHGIQTWIQKV